MKKVKFLVFVGFLMTCNTSLTMHNKGLKYTVLDIVLSCFDRDKNGLWYRSSSDYIINSLDGIKNSFGITPLQSALNTLDRIIVWQVYLSILDEKNLKYKKRN